MTPPNDTHASSRRMCVHPDCCACPALARKYAVGHPPSHNHCLGRHRRTWHDLGRGLAWWYTSGRPVEDPRLALMQAIWDSDGQLAYFAAWAFQVGRDNFRLDDAATTSAFSNADWWRDFRRLGRRYRSDPFHGGTNPLHLGHSHFDFGTDTDVAPAALHVDPTARQAVLVTRDFLTWREELAIAGRQLPPRENQRSWHVDVFDKRVGWLGTYRQSPSYQALKHFQAFPSLEACLASGGRPLK